MSQKLSKVDVKHMPSVPEHYVIIVAVTDSQDIRGYTASCTRVDEVFWSLGGREKKWIDIKYQWKNIIHVFKSQSWWVQNPSQAKQTLKLLFFPPKYSSSNRQFCQKSLDITLFSKNGHFVFLHKWKRKEEVKKNHKTMLAKKRVQDLYSQCTVMAL